MTNVLTGSECETSWVMLCEARTRASLCIAATCAGCCSLCWGIFFFSTMGSPSSCCSCSVRSSPRSALRCSFLSRSSCFWCSFSVKNSKFNTMINYFNYNFNKFGSMHFRKVFSTDLYTVLTTIRLISSPFECINIPIIL